MRSLLPFRRRGHPPRQKSRGQSLVEFALVLPIFLVFLAAALDLGRVFYANITLNNATREGAMEAAKRPAAFGAGQNCDASDAGRIVCRVKFESASSAVAIGDGDITASCSSACTAAAGSTVTVKVKGNFQLVTPILSAIFGGQTVNLNSAATAQILYYPGAAPASPPPAPIADFTTFSTRSCTCPSLTIDFADISTGSPSAWQWNFGDGNASTEQNPSHTFGPGTWTVSLTVINITDSSTRTKNNYITVDVPPTPTPTIAPTPTPTPAPTCSHPTNVIGMIPLTAVAILNGQGFIVSNNGDLNTGPKNKVQAQNPDATQCLNPGTLITIHWRPS